MNNFITKIRSGDGKNKCIGKTNSLESSIIQENAFRSVTFSDYRALGMKVEKSSHGHAIITDIIPGSRAESSGLQKGDLLCQNDTNFGVILSYMQFLQLLSSSVRSLTLTVRQPTDLEKKTFEEEKANMQERLIHEPGVQIRPLTEQARKVIQSVKKKRQEHPFSLGHYAHEIKNLSADREKNKTISMLQSNSINVEVPSMSICTTPAGKNMEEFSNFDKLEEDFNSAFSMFVERNIKNSNMSRSLHIMKELIVNATTKGQELKEGSEQFRKVRLSNPKIEKLLVNVGGALDVMRCLGFKLDKDNGDESCLVYPEGKGGYGWLNKGLERMGEYERLKAENL